MAKNDNVKSVLVKINSPGGTVVGSESLYVAINSLSQKKPVISQREMAKELGFSLGKLNYCLKALKDKGLVKLKNFQKQKNKLNYLQYVITPKGISFRTKMTINFMKKKLAEYDELKKELKKKKEKSMKILF